jgi:sec-independent protein translocase protein TatB
MGGLGPGIGGLEYLVIAAVALIVVGPERLPAMLRQLGKWVAKMRGMANEFRASFDEMARQSELDELRKEVEALRSGQGAVGQGMVRLGAEADAAFKDIKSELDKPAVSTPSPPVALNSPEFPDPVMTPLPVSDANVADAATLETAKPGKAAKARAARTDDATVATRTRAPRKPAASAAAKPATSPARKPRKPKTDT